MDSKCGRETGRGRDEPKQCQGRASHPSVDWSHLLRRFEGTAAGSAAGGARADRAPEALVGRSISARSAAARTSASSFFLSWMLRMVCSLSLLSWFSLMMSA